MSTEEKPNSTAASENTDEDVKPNDTTSTPETVAHTGNVTGGTTDNDSHQGHKRNSIDSTSPEDTISGALPSNNEQEDQTITDVVAESPSAESTMYLPKKKSDSHIRDDGDVDSENSSHVDLIATGMAIPESEFVDSANMAGVSMDAGNIQQAVTPNNNINDIVKEDVDTSSSATDSIPFDALVQSSDQSITNCPSQMTNGDAEVSTIAASISGRWEEVLRLNEKELSEVGGPFAWGGGDPNADDTPRGPLDSVIPTTDDAVVLFVTGAVDERRMSDEAMLTRGESLFFYDGQSQESLPLLVGRKKRQKKGWRSVWPFSYFVSAQYEEDMVTETVIGAGQRSAPGGHDNRYLNRTVSKFALFVILSYLIAQILAFGWFVHLRNKKSLYDAMNFVSKWSANTLDVQTGAFWKIFTSFFVHTDSLVFFLNFISAAQSSLFMTSTAYDVVTMVCAYISCGVAATFSNVWTGCSYTYGAGAATIGLATFLFVQLDRRRRQGLPVWYLWTVALLSVVQFVVLMHDAGDLIIAIFTGILFGLIMKSLRRKSTRKRRSAVTLFCGYCFSLTGFFIFQYLLLALQHRICIPQPPSLSQ
eukprot:Lankesteria_metandrocarpae@DN4940_c0_g1_i1.p1